MTKYSFTELIGSIDRIDPFLSKYVIPRKVDVWTPPQYEKDDGKRYTVLYMHDGENLFDPSTSKFSHADWGMDETVTRLMQESKIRPTIVVGIWSTQKRVLEYMPQKLPITPAYNEMTSMLKKYSNMQVCSDDYLKFIVDEVKPFIDSNYRTLPDQKNTFIMGSSMGGLISMYAVCEYPQIFGGAGCVSTHFPIGRGIALKYMERNLPAPGSHKFYFDYGTETLDKKYEKYQLRADKIMLEKGYTSGIDWMSRKFEGHAHSEIDWRKRVHVSLEFLLGGE